MARNEVVALVLAAALLPAGVRAQDGETGGEAYTDDWVYEPPGEKADTDYDVSVDVGASPSVTAETFNESLGSYGEWVNVSPYGRVWHPNVATGWRPYYYGRWEWTNEGWLWVSDEPWGWAAYHYGRWTYDNYFGWVWVPGYQWAPAWVAWRYSGDVVGWAPLAPGFSVYVSTYPFVDYWWTFVPCARFVSVPVYSVAYAPRYTRNYFYRTAPAPARPAPRAYPGRFAPAPAPAWGGPAPRAVEQRIGRPLTPVRVVAAPSPNAVRSSPGEVAIYRPGAPSRSRFESRGAGPAPARAAPNAGFAPGHAPVRGAPVHRNAFFPPRGPPRGPASGPASGQAAPPPGGGAPAYTGRSGPPAPSSSGSQGTPPSGSRGGAPRSAPAPSHGEGGGQRGGR